MNELTADVGDEPGVPRIEPVSMAARGEYVDWSNVDAAFRQAMEGKPVPNVVATFANHGELATDLLPLLVRLSNGLLPALDRELVILRVAVRTRARYVWAHHRVIGAAAGLTDHEIERVVRGPDAGWEPARAALLRAVDELHGSSARISESTWRALTARYDNRQMIELATLTGVYTMVAYVLNSCQTPIDEWRGPSVPWPATEAG